MTINHLRNAVRARALGLLALAAALLAGTANPGLAADGHAKWTFMVYLAANNNLEPNSIINLMEMAEIGSTDDVNIVVQMTRPPDYSGYFGEWGGTRRYYVTKSSGDLSSGDFQVSPTRFAAYVDAIKGDLGLPDDQVRQITRGSAKDREAAAMQLSVPAIETDVPLDPLQLTALADMGADVNSGDGATLADFGKWAVQTYPADHYGLVMWDHGGGWSMIASDDTLGPAGIHMPDFDSALQQITEAAGQKFDFIGFDACLMSQLAVARVVAPFADYQIAAEELVPGFGWDYTPAIKALVENPEISVPELGRQIVDGFDALYATTQKQAAQSYDMGVLDLSKLDGVLASLDSFAAAAKAAPGELGNIATARANAQLFASVGEDAGTTAYMSSVDLADFMRLVGSLSQDDALKGAAKDVIAASQELVLYHKASKSLPHANGLSVFFPENKNVFAGADGERYRGECSASLPSWQSFLDEPYGTATASAAPLTLKVAAVTTTPEAPGSIYDTPVVTYDLDGKNIVGLTADIVYAIDEKTNVVLDSFPVLSGETTEDGTQVNDYPDGASTNDFYWNARLPSLGDGKQSVLVLMTTNDQDPQHGFIEGNFTQKRTGKSYDAYLLIDADSWESTGVWAISGDGANSPVAQVTPQAGDSFEPVYVVIDDAGQGAVQPSGVVLHFGKDPLTVTDEAGPDGNYLVSLTATDATGTTSTDTAMIDVANDGLDPAMQGFKDLGFGLSFLYPADWTDVSVYAREDGLDELYVSDIDEEVYLSAIDYNDVASLDDMKQRLDDEVASLSDVQPGDPVDESVGDHPGVSETYSYTDADGVAQQGLAVAVFVPETGQGYLLKVEAPEDRFEDGQRAISDVLGSAVFFPPVQ